MLCKKSEFIEILKQDWCFSYGFISLYDVKNICAEFFEADSMTNVMNILVKIIYINIYIY